jgi:[acyl-carrier-protein] S-malonyltransferase
MRLTHILINPSTHKLIMKTAFLFPGQGAQLVGMGADVANSYNIASELFYKANNILGFDLAKLCFEGPAEQLNSTVISQPAIFITSAAILAVLQQKNRFVPADVTAGLSLGEYTALYAAGALSFEDALVLVHKRGQAMQAAADACPGEMVSIIGLDEDKVHQLCEEALAGDEETETADDEQGMMDEVRATSDEERETILVPVNFNCPGQIVISGSKSACRRAKDLAGKYGAIKAVRLETAGAFHTELMAGAAAQLKNALSKCKISDPKTKVIANITAEYYKNSSQIADGLVKQLVRPILWQKCMERLLADGVEKFYEIGPGRVLTGLFKRISRKTEVINISTAGAISEILGQ